MIFSVVILIHFSVIMIFFYLLFILFRHYSCCTSRILFDHAFQLIFFLFMYFCLLALFHYHVISHASSLGFYSVSYLSFLVLTCRKFLCWIHRAEYNPDQYLWEKEFTLAGRKFKRQDLEASTDIRYQNFCILMPCLVTEHLLYTSLDFFSNFFWSILF